jgi:hypothetical protein
VSIERRFEETLSLVGMLVSWLDGVSGIGR